jgi:hypothetical protein
MPVAGQGSLVDTGWGRYWFRRLDEGGSMGRMKELLYVTSGEAQFDMADHGEDPRAKPSIARTAEPDDSVSPQSEREREQPRSQSA